MFKLALQITALALLLLIFPAPQVPAQLSAWHDDPGRSFREALDLYEKGKYSAARQAFFSLMHNPQVKEDKVLRAEASYYEALCAIELFNEDSKDLLENFAADYPDNNHTNMVHFNLARSEYRKKHYRSAGKYFAMVRTNELDQEELYEYHFKKGYSHLKEEEFADARREFAKIKDSQSKYSAPVNYYYAHLAYTDGQYEEARAGFSKIEQDATFKAIIPYYFAHIAYLQGKWKEVTERVPPLLERGNATRNAELNRMAGDAYYYLGEYAAAVPYLERYNAAPGARTSREDRYQLAMAMFHAGQYAPAIQWFEQVTGPEDSLAQLAFYHLGFCYVQEGEKEFARKAFLSAYKLEQDIIIREDALFNYAKLAYELGYNPFNEAIRALEAYIGEYPRSPRIDEAYGYLIDLFLSTKNYAGALEALGKISRLNDELRQAYQKVAFYHGIEQLNARKYDEAIALFHKSLEFQTDRRLNAEALYWTGEAHYRQKDYRSARNYYERFLTSPGAFELPLYPLTHYNIAYTWFKKQDYAQAGASFRKFLQDPGNAPVKMVADANIRTGDCLFIRKAYDDALPFYQRAIQLDVLDQDYAKYQRAIALGVLDRPVEKVSQLERLIADHPNSPYRDDALFELGNSWLLMQEADKAMQALRAVTQEYPGSSYEKQALLKIGLIHYNRNLDDQAIATFKRVIEDYPGTSEAREALATMQSIYVELNRTEDFFAYTSGLPFASVSDRTQDSITYLAAENQYMSGNTEAALKGFTTYLDRFPKGIYHTAARFYRSECLYATGRKDEALAGYEAALDAPGPFTETALLKASAILFDQGAWAQALAHYQRLQQSAEYPNNLLTAHTGIMRCQHYLGNDLQALEAAQRVLESDKSPERLLTEAHLITAKSRLALGDTAAAETAFAITARLDKGSMGAEASYYNAYLRFQTRDLDRAEKAAFELVNNYPAQDHWIAKAFILIADIYVARENYFQARHTLQSIIDNHDGEELVTMARERLRHIAALEAAAQQPKEQPAPEEDFEDLF